jgi:LacI family transcriptional regulator
MDDALGGRLALDHLAGLGHRRIAQIGGPAGIEPAERRACAYRERADELGLGEIPIVHAEFLEQDGAEALERLLATNGDVTAIYTGTVSQAAGALHVAWRRGIDVPRRLSVVAHADMGLAEVTVPPLTTVRMPLPELGSAGVDALLAQVRTGETADTWSRRRRSSWFAGRRPPRCCRGDPWVARPTRNATGGTASNG